MIDAKSETATEEIGDMKKICIVLLTIFFSNNLLANVVTMDVNPNRPVVGETFQLVFRIKTSDSEEPYISFDRGTADVIGKSDRGVSINTTIINGKFSTTRTLTHVYEMVASRSGPLRISNIKIEIGGKGYKVRSKTISILREAVRAKDFFLQAEPSKTEVYLGEGVDIRYYLYTKVPIVSQEVKVFPKLNKFIKRFHMINREQTSTVEYMGEIYKKSLKYSARIYPEEVGKAYVDPLKLRVQYSKSSGNSPFGAFGLRMRQYQTRSIQSKKIEIKVKKIPTENVPKDFTGLVGDHDFSFRLNKEKYLVNEVVEAKLEVSGPGALENYAAPKLYTHPGLEEFDTKSEFSEVSKSLGKKVFDYTFLARNNFTIPPREITFSTFDPNSSNFVTKRIELPTLRVQGGIVKPNTGGHTNTQPKNNSASKSPMSVGFVAPAFMSSFDTKRLNFFRIGNYILGVILITLLLLPIMRYMRQGWKKTTLQLAINDIKSNGLTYHRLYVVLNELPLDCNVNTLQERLEKSRLSKKAKSYFLNSLENCEKGDFSGIGSKSKQKVEMKYFSELSKVLRENEIENSQNA